MTPAAAAAAAVTQEDHSPFITAYLSISGWTAVQMHWNTEPELGGFWEPWQTGFGKYDTREQAEIEGRQWAEDEGCRFIPARPEGSI